MTKKEEDLPPPPSYNETLGRAQRSETCPVELGEERTALAFGSDRLEVTCRACGRLVRVRHFYLSAQL